MLEVRGVKPPKTFLVRVGSKRVKSHLQLRIQRGCCTCMHVLSLSLSHTQVHPCTLPLHFMFNALPIHARFLAGGGGDKSLRLQEGVPCKFVN